jgi:hypothetical protein
MSRLLRDNKAYLFSGGAGQFAEAADRIVAVRHLELWMAVPEILRT